MTRRVPELDMLRFIAAFGVMIYHFSYRPSVNARSNEALFGGLQDLARFGYLGVELFFIISGFVILWTATGRKPRQFVASRFLRLYPTFWACMLLTSVAMWGLAAQDRWPTFSQLLVNATMVPGYLGVDYVDGVYWTLAIELKFYFLVFVLMLCHQLVHVERYLAAWLMGLSVCQIWGVKGPLSSLVMFPYGAFFVAGCLLYLVFARGASGRLYLLLAWATVLACFSSFGSAKEFIRDPSLFDKTLAVIAVITFVGAMLLIVRGRLRFGWAATATTLGAMTYPLYLLHNNIGKLVFARLEPFLSEWLRLAIIVGLSLGLAWVVTELVEWRLNRWLKALPLFRRLSA